MSLPKAEPSWDFTRVFTLLDTLSEKDTSPLKQSATSKTVLTPSAISAPNENIHQHEPRATPSSSPAEGLGDFSRIWRFLGSPVTVPEPGQSPRLAHRIPEKMDYTSDGAIGAIPTSARKQLQWRDEVNDGTLTDVAPAPSDEERALTKTQRKKLNRSRRVELAVQARKVLSDVESEVDMSGNSHIPAAKASVHTIKPRSREKSGTAITTPVSTAPKATTKSKRAATEPVAVPASQSITPPSSTKDDADDLPLKVAESAHRYLARYNSEPPETKSVVGNGDEEQGTWPVSSPPSAAALSFRPASVRPKKIANYDSSTTAVDSSNSSTGTVCEISNSSAGAVNGNSNSSTAAVDGNRNSSTAAVEVASTPRPVSLVASRPVITPKIIRSGPDRHWAFLLKLINNFYEDRASLIAPANLTNHSHHPDGIHVFVDASNIFIGFHDQLKRARGIPSGTRVPRVNMSFDALALLLERRRPVAKRVLAGSTPHLPAFDVARAVGYDCAILDKVLKARELTSRQRFFALDRDARRRARRRSGDATDGGDTSGGSSGGEAAGPTHAPERFVEQGVDEILHLKILESVVDVEAPSTMVLATGDAAQAEYSSGFMVMVERALRKGWRVELVSWSANISGAYTQGRFRAKWGDRFRVVELDDFAEELLDM